MSERGSRTRWAPIPDSDRYWAVGSTPAKKAHRIVGNWPGNDARQTACGAMICLHAEYDSVGWPFPNGGMSFEFNKIPGRYAICLQCVEQDETVE